MAMEYPSFILSFRFSVSDMRGDEIGEFLSEIERAPILGKSAVDLGGVVKGDIKEAGEGEEGVGEKTEVGGGCFCGVFVISCFSSLSGT